MLKNLVIPEVETSEIVEDPNKKIPVGRDPIIENIGDDDETNTKLSVIYKQWFIDHENGMIFDSYYTRLGIKREDLIKPKLISERPEGTQDLEGFVNAYWGKQIGGLTIGKNLTWGQVAEIFEAYKYSLIKNKHTLITHYTLNKRTLNEDTDYAYNKPNDKGFDEDTKSIYTLGATIATGNGTSFDITLGMVRRYKENGIPEGTYMDKLINSDHEMTIAFDVKNLNEDALENFINSVKYDGDLINGNIVFIPVTGMR